MHHYRIWSLQLLLLAYVRLGFNTKFPDPDQDPCFRTDIETLSFEIETKTLRFKSKTNKQTNSIPYITLHLTSGVVEGECCSPNIFLGNTVPPNNIWTRGNGDTVASHQIGLQKIKSLGKS